MILPIHVFGSPALRVETEPVDEASEDLDLLLDNMIESMHEAAGVGLAAPQVGRTERLFVMDLSQVSKQIDDEASGEMPEVWDGPVAIVNPEIPAVSEETSEYEEGCLSIPDILETVVRPVAIRLRYLDRHMRQHEVELSGMPARVVQHEFDHLNGILFTDRIRPMRRRLLKRKLRDMAKGDVEADYALALPPGAVQGAVQKG